MVHASRKQRIRYCTTDFRHLAFSSLENARHLCDHAAVIRQYRATDTRLMSHLRRSARALTSLVEFAKIHLAGVRLQFMAVLLLEAALTAITGIGLLLVLPLLGLLGVAGGGADSPLWSRVNDALERVGITLTLETGLMFFVIVIGLRALLVWRRQTWQVEVEQRFQTSLRSQLYEAIARAEMYSLQRLRTSEFKVELIPPA